MNQFGLMPHREICSVTLDNGGIELNMKSVMSQATICLFKVSDPRRGLRICDFVFLLL